MAEGWARALKSDIFDVYSAGIETHGLNSNAVKVMAEAGVDISSHKSKLITDFDNTSFDAVITVCGHAHETCPYFPPLCKIIHVGFEDPPKLAQELAEQGKDKDAQLDCYRKVRDEIKAFVEKMPDTLFPAQSNTTT